MIMVFIVQIRFKMQIYYSTCLTHVKVNELVNFNFTEESSCNYFMQNFMQELGCNYVFMD